MTREREEITKEEAVEILKDCELNPCVPKDKEAAEVAIKALEQEPCKDAINRADLKEPKFIIAENDYQKGWNDALDSVYENASSIQQKKGRWIKRNNDYFDWYECSECGYGSEGEMRYSREYDVRTNYCPKCGKQMLEVENEIN